MPDYGARVADKAIRDTERKLRSTYSIAQRELRKKLRDFNDKYKVKDALKRKQLAEGKISKQDYANWKAGQVFQRKQWEAKVREVASVMSQSNAQAARIINEGRLDVFSENYNFLAFLGEKQLGISFDVYNTQAVARLIQDDPQILPEWKIDEEKDYEWNAKKVNNIVQQGIIQGEGIPEMTKRLCSDLATQNENKMRTFARTAITGAQNAGRQRQMEDAAGMGIEVHKQWIATLDSRTRDWHRDRDGEEVPYNEDFSGGLEYPGDPAGDPADVYNCRCTMITVYPEHAAHHDGGGRRAYSEYEDEDGEHRKGYVTENPNVYEGWSEKAYRRWLEQKEEQNRIARQGKEQKRRIVNGKDISGTWKRREAEFDFEIEDVLNAQGFDGLPQVVSQEEFDKLVKENSFIAQRTYSAESQETLELYRQQLYEGKFYVECSGGSRIGNGMYCAANYDGVLTSEIKAEMLSYSSLGESRFEKDIDRIKINELRIQRAEKAGEKILAMGGSNQQAYSAFQKICKISDEEYAKKYAPELLAKKGVSFVETFTFQKGAKIIDYHDLYAMKEELVNSLPISERHKYRKMDLGSFAALKGYDAIVDGTTKTADTVILNRTKCVFLRGD